MKKRMKNIVTVMILGVLILFHIIHTNASEGKKDLSIPEEIIKEYFDSMGKDWDSFAELYTSGQTEGFKSFLHNEDEIRENTGVLNVREAIFKEAVEIDYEDVKLMLSTSIMGSDYYSGKEIKIYAVGAEYLVAEDSKYFSNGICYYLIVLINEDGNWKVSELRQIAEPKELREKGYMFSEDYSRTEEMMEMRYAGYLMNGNGKIFADMDNNPVVEIITPYTVINNRTVPTIAQKLFMGYTIKIIFNPSTKRFDVLIIY